MAVYGGGHCWRFKVLLFQAIKTSSRFLEVWHRLKIFLVLQTLWSFQEVVVNGGFNFEWNIFEFLSLDYGRLWRWSLLEVSSLIISCD